MRQIVQWDQTIELTGFDERILYIIFAIKEIFHSLAN